MEFRPTSPAATFGVNGSASVGGTPTGLVAQFTISASETDTAGEGHLSYFSGTTGGTNYHTERLNNSHDFIHDVWNRSWITGLAITNEGNVGIGTPAPKNKLDIEDGLAVGSSYSGTKTAPSNGAIIQGNVGIGATSPTRKLDVEGRIQALGYDTGDIIFQKDGERLWQMYEDEDGLYLKSLKTDKVYRFLLQEVE